MECFWNDRKLKLNMAQYAISRLTIFHSVLYLYAFWGKDHLLTCKQSSFITWFEEKLCSSIENDGDDDDDDDDDTADRLWKNSVP